MENPKAVSTLSVIFFLSGSSALIFETVWFRIASTVLGSSIWSATAVLMAFMGGLAIGNGLMTAFGHRIKNPAKFYLLIETVIGITGFSVILLMPKLTPYIASLLSDMNHNSILLLVSRFSIACFFLLIPATAMGTTLPVMQKLITQYDESFINSIARLYGWNTIGAVFGVLFAEFVLIELLGIISTAAVALTFNMMVILIMLKVFGNTTEYIHKSQAGKFNINISRYLIAAFLAGMLLLALEIIWFRYLLVARFGSSLLFAIMLAIVLIGIGLGGLLISKIKLTDKGVNQAVFFAPIAASIFTLMGFYFFHLFFAANILNIKANLLYFITGSFVLIFSTSFISGMIFPLLGECIYRKNQVVSSSAGYLTLANTIGAVIGSALASFYLLPEIGIEKSLFIILFIYLLISLIVIGKSKNQLFALTSAVILITVLFPHGLVKSSYNKIYSTFFPDYKVIKFQEGLNQSIAYIESMTMGKRNKLRLMTNNYSMSGTELKGQRYMRLYAYFPYLFANDIEDVLQISYGVGNTAESVIMLPELKHFDVVDMSPDILELSDIVHEVSGFHPLRDERTNAHVEDGRFYLQTTDKKYDLITAEPPPPMGTGVVNLYTQEYFQLIHNALKPEGVTTYWLPVHSLSEHGSLAIIKAFCNVFKDCSLWNGVTLNFMLVGSKSGLKPVNQSLLSRRWNHEMSSEFSKIGFDNAEQVFATFIGDHDYLNKLTEYARPVIDNYPHRIISYRRRALGKVGLYSELIDIKRREKDFISSTYINSLFSEEFIASTAREFTREAIVTSQLLTGYDFVLLNPDYYFWDHVLDRMSAEKQNFLMLLFFNLSPAILEIYEDAFSSEKGKTAYQFEYLTYLFIDKNYQLLELEVDHYLKSNTKLNANTALAYRYKFLSKLYLKTATMDDVLKSIKMSEVLRKDGFNNWAMKVVHNYSNAE